MSPIFILDRRILVKSQPGDKWLSGSKKIVFGVMLAFIFATNARANKEGQAKIDSLLNNLASARPDTNKIKTLEQIAFAYTQFNPDLGLKYAGQALQLAEQLSWDKGMAMAYNSIGLNYYVKSNYPKALDNLLKCLTKVSSLNDKKKEATIYNNLGILYSDRNDTVKSRQYLNKSLVINTKIKNKVELAVNYGNLALLNYRMNRLAQSNAYYYKALALEQSENNHDAQSRILSNISLNKIKTKNYCEALELNFKALNISPQTISHQIKAFCYSCLGETYYRMATDPGKNENCSASRSDKKSLLLQAIKYLNLSASGFESVNHLIYQANSYETLSGAYEALGDHKNALLSYKKYTALNDSVYSKDKLSEIVNIEDKFQIDLKDKQLTIQTLRLENDQKRMLLQIFLFAIVLIVIFFIAFTLYKNGKNYKLINNSLNEKNKELTVLNATKDKFFSIIAHDLKSPLSGFLGLTNLMAEDLKSFTQEELQSIALDLKQSAQRLHELLENLLQWATMQRGTLKFQAEVIQIKAAVNTNIKLFNEVCTVKSIEIISDIPAALTVCTDANMLQTIFRNIISNALKFSFRGSKINISAKKTANGFVEIQIQDFGIGMSPSLKNNLFRIDTRTNRPGTSGEPSSGLGLILCKEFIEKMGGNLWVESEEGQGSVFHFTIPENK